MSEPLHHEVWRSLGTDDPDWAVATDPTRRGGGWLADLDTFYASGEEDVQRVLAAVPAVHEAALDFGSGTGRLSFALARHFRRVTAVDVSPTMLGVLASRAVERQVDGVTPVLLPDFRARGDHDLAVSLLVLQHLPDQEAVFTALRLMIEALRPGGWLFVEIPSTARTWRARLQPRFRAYRVLRRWGATPSRLHRWGFSGISMLTMPREAIVGWLEENGARVHRVATRQDPSWRYVTYVAQRTI